jgi:4-amino-4-deoxy-L-arabinose transferase-like glycosyltransferase
VNTNRNDIVPVGALLLLGSIPLLHLMAVPAFEDEGSQLRWIWRLIEAGEWLQPFGDGKPLEAWPMVPLVRLGLQPLAAIRAVHVLVGMIGAVLTYRLALEVSDRRTAFASGILFAICPFVVYLQRLALSDILLCTAGIWVLLSVSRLIDLATWPRAAVLAFALLLTSFCKFPVGFIFLISMPLALLLMPAHERERWLRRPLSAKLLAAHAPAILLALLVIVVAMIRSHRGQSPGFGLQDLAGIAMGGYQNIAAAVPRPHLVDELTTQLSWPVAIIGLIGLAASALLGDWRQRWLIAVGALPMLLIGLVTEFWFSRYLLFTLPPLIVGAASGWRLLWLRAARFRKSGEIAVFAVCVAFMGHQSALIIFDPANAKWSPLDRLQYFEGSGSGYGYSEAAKFILAAPDAPLMIYSLDGHSAYQLRNYLPAKWGSRVKPIFYGEDGEALRSEAARVANLLHRTPAWIIVSKQLLHRYLESSFGDRYFDQVELREVAVFDKPGLRTQLALYEVTRR